MKKIKLKEKFDFLYKNVESQKTDEGEKFTVSVTPKNYPIFIKLFPLKYDVVLSETGYEGYPEGKMKINIFKSEIYVGGEGERKYIYYENYEPKNDFYFFGGIRISNAKVHLKKDKSEKEYEIERIDYLDDFGNEVLSVEYIENVPQFQKNPKFKLVRSKGKIKNPYIEPAWKQNEDGSFSKIISSYEYCNDFSYHAEYEANGYFFRRFNKNYQDCIEVYRNEEDYQKQCEAIRERREYIDFTFERQLYRYENHFLNIRNIFEHYKVYELDFFSGLPDAHYEESLKNFIEVTRHNKEIPLQYMKLLEKFYNVEIFMKKSNLKESALEEVESFNIPQAYPVKIVYLDKKYKEIARIEFDDFGIATFKGFHKVVFTKDGEFLKLSESKFYEYFEKVEKEMKKIGKIKEETEK
jgi:hypothetical protein